MAKWMTNGILKSINTKDKLHKKTCENGCRWKCSIYHFDKKNLIVSRIHYVHSSITEAKRLYYLRTFALYKNDMKQIWAVIKDTLKKKCIVLDQLNLL